MDNGKFTNNRERLEIYTNTIIEWKPQFDALLRYGGWLTPKRELYMFYYSSIAGIPKNFVEELLLHLANSRYDNNLFIFYEF